MKKPVDAFGDRFELLKCLEAQKIETGIILVNGLIFEGFPSARNMGKVRLSSKEGVCSDTTFTDVWDQDVAALMFRVKDFSTLPFEPYQRERLSTEISYVDELDLLREHMKECHDFYDKFGLLLYMMEGRRQNVIPTVKIFLKGRNEFSGVLKIVDKDRVLLEMECSQYLDVHHLMICAVQFEIKRSWPYDPTEGC